SVGQIRADRAWLAPGDAARKLLDADAARCIACKSAGERIESREGRDRAAIVAHRDRHVGDEEILVMELARPEKEAPGRHRMEQRLGELSALIRGKLWLTDAVRHAIEATDAGEPVRRQRPAEV